jgi:hypothetical protein
MVETEGSQMVIWLRAACWVSKATRQLPCTHTHKYVRPIGFSRQKSFRECALVLGYTHIASLVTATISWSQ